jgi:hypothetical protein
MEYGFGLFVQDIATVAQRFHLDLEHLQVEIFSPGRQAIFIETLDEHVFRIHLSLEEDRIVAVKQIAGPPVPQESDLFEKYKMFMK